MNSVECLIQLDLNDLAPKKKTFNINVERISNILHKKGIKEDFEITVETVDPDTLYDFESAIYDIENAKVKVDKKALYKKCLEMCNIAIIEPKYNDPQLISFLGVKMKQPTPQEVWLKLFVKSEIVSIGQQIINYSREVLGNTEEYNEGMKKIVDYNGEDINLIKEKMNAFQESNNKMRIDIFKGLNESQDFFEKKYNSIISLINK